MSKDTFINYIVLREDNENTLLKFLMTVKVDTKHTKL